MSKTAFPLCWPDGWPRTAAHLRKRSGFGVAGGYEGFDANRRWVAVRARSIEEARQFLSRELKRMGVPGDNTTLSTNLRLRVDGNPMSGQAQPTDVGAAIYFKLNGRPVALACDKWDRVQDNIYAIGKHVEAHRLLVKKHHPDAGGDAELFRRVQAAWEDFERSAKEAA